MFSVFISETKLIFGKERLCNEIVLSYAMIVKLFVFLTKSGKIESIK